MNVVLSRSMETALLCAAGIRVPLWSAHTWTVATSRALARRGFLKGGRITRKGRSLANRIVANRPPVE